MLALAVAMALAVQSPPTTEPCAYDKAGTLALSYAAFDETARISWRKLSEKRACQLTAADLLAAYRAANLGGLKLWQIHDLYWHEGQVRAAAGQADRAVGLLLAGTDPDGPYDPADYTLGTVAFLQGDLLALRAARDRLARQPPPRDWEAQQVKAKSQLGYAPTWPLNLDVLDGLIACFGKPYVEAYTTACRKAR